MGGDTGSTGFGARASGDGVSGICSRSGDAVERSRKDRGAGAIHQARQVQSLPRVGRSRWYLGYRRCNAVGASTCGAIQPLSGPYRDYSSNPRNTGLLFEYFDESGSRLTPGGSPLALARVDITARAESRQRIVVEGREPVPGRLSDSRDSDSKQVTP